MYNMLFAVTSQRSHDASLIRLYVPYFATIDAIIVLYNSGQKCQRASARWRRFKIEDHLTDWLTDRLIYELDLRQFANI